LRTFHIRNRFWVNTSMQVCIVFKRWYLVLDKSRLIISWKNYKTGIPKFFLGLVPRSNAHSTTTSSLQISEGGQNGHGFESSLKFSSKDYLTTYLHTHESNSPHRKWALTKTPSLCLLISQYCTKTVSR
jgi:hypothetical protein